MQPQARRTRRGPALLRGLLPPARSGRRARFAYAVLSIPLAVVYGTLLAGLVAAVITAAQGVGVLLFLAVLALARASTGLERLLARRLLGVSIATGIRQRRERGFVVRRLRRLLGASSTWRALAWLGVRVLLGAGVFATASFGGVVAVGLVDYPRWSSWSGRHPLLDLLAFAAAALLALLVLVVVDLEVRIAALMAPRLLGVSAEEELAALRMASQHLADRNRVARDLHDTIGHALTASLLQAGAARRSLRQDPDAPSAPVDATFARQALEHIENNTRAALDELDRALAVLGAPAAPALMGDRLPAPDLTYLDGLLAGLRDGGLPVTLVLHADLDGVPDAVSQLAYRVVQEGTTNVLRHAGCPPTTVEVARTPDALTVRVRNAPAAPADPRPGPGGGRGLAGLQERAAAVGGRLAVGPTPAGGFEVRADLPLAAAA